MSLRLAAVTATCCKIDEQGCVDDRVRSSERMRSGGGGGQTADTIVKRSKTSGLLLYPVLYWQLRFLGYIDDGSVQLDRNRNIAWYMGKRKE